MQHGTISLTAEVHTMKVIGNKSAGVIDYYSRKSYRGCHYVRVVESLSVSGVFTYWCLICNSDGEIHPDAEPFMVAAAYVKYQRRAKRKIHMNRPNSMFNHRIRIPESR